MEIYTGYIANIKKYKSRGLHPIFICRYPPAKWNESIEPMINWLPQLAPSKSLLSKVKYKGMSFEEYSEEYIKELYQGGRFPAEKWVKSLDNLQMKVRNDLILCCYEADPLKCHRSVLADFLNEARPDNHQITEYLLG